MSQDTKDTVDEAAEQLQETKRKIDEMLSADRATAQEIEQIVQGKLTSLFRVKLPPSLLMLEDWFT